MYGVACAPYTHHLLTEPTMTETTIDWPQLLDDMAFLLGEEDSTQPGGRMRIGTRVLAQQLNVHRESIRRWLDGAEPRHGEGEMLLKRWAILTCKAREFAPRCRPVFSASRMKERA